jgi:CBS domain-containing protein
MNASDLMTAPARSCRTTDTLERAAQVMWDADCGVVPVVDGDGRVVGMVTDRDICMAAYMQGRALWLIPVSNVMAKHVYGVRETDPIEEVEATMRHARVHRVPVLDAEGRLKGVLSMNDLARNAHRSVGHKADGLRYDSVVETLAAIGMSHATRARDAKDGAAARVSG